MVESNRPKPPPLDVAITAANSNSSQQHQQRRQQQQQQHQQQQHQQHQRHTKTVHFETDVFREVQETATCNSTSVTSLPDQFDRHVQQLFSFIGSALSAGRDHYCTDGDNHDSNSDDSDSDYDNDSDGEGYYFGGSFCGGCDKDDDRRSVSDNETARRRSSNHYHHHHHHRRTAGPTAESFFMQRGARTTSFERDVDRGNTPFRHMHCKTTAGTCNRVFLKKVIPLCMVNSV